jgi:hypothetical protein
MSEWWTYRLSDFLLFSPRTYFRLFELYNRDHWPLHLAAGLAGLLILVFAIRSRPAWRGRATAILLAVAWAWVGWAFLLGRYQSVNWTAQWFAAAFAVEALALLWAGFSRDGFTPVHRSGSGRVALALLIYALLLHPFAGPLSGRSWSGVELFGMTPDATVLATLGAVTLFARRGRLALLIIPVLWCGISGATLWALGAPDAPVLPIAAILAIVVALRSTEE